MAGKESAAAPGPTLKRIIDTLTRTTIYNRSQVSEVVGILSGVFEGPQLMRSARKALRGAQLGKVPPAWLARQFKALAAPDPD